MVVTILPDKIRLQTQVEKKTLNPVWDKAIIFDGEFFNISSCGVKNVCIVVKIRSNRSQDNVIFSAWSFKLALKGPVT